MERRPGSGIARRPKLTPMTFNDGAADGKTQSHAMALGGKERFKDLVQVSLGQAYPVIADTYLDDLFRVDAAAYIDLSLGGRGLHGVEGVAHQVENDLLYLDIVHRHHREGIEVQPYICRIPVEFGIGDFDGLDYEGVDVRQ